MKISQEQVEKLHALLKEIALDNFDSVFEAAEWTMESMKILIDPRRHELKIPQNK
jgi:hypothetical protein